MTLNRRDFVATVGLSLVGGAASRAAVAKELAAAPVIDGNSDRSEEHTSELQSQ